MSKCWSMSYGKLSNVFCVAFAILQKLACAVEVIASEANRSATEQLEAQRCWWRPYTMDDFVMKALIMHCKKKRKRAHNTVRDLFIVVGK